MAGCHVNGGVDLVQKINRRKRKEEKKIELKMTLSLLQTSKQTLQNHWKLKKNLRVGLWIPPNGLWQKKKKCEGPSLKPSIVALESTLCRHSKCYFSNSSTFHFHFFNKHYHTCNFFFKVHAFQIYRIKFLDRHAHLRLKSLR